MKKTSRSFFSEPFAKGLKVLNLFGPVKKTLSLKDIASALDTNKSSAYRFTNTLVELGYLKKDPKTKLLSLDQKAYYMGQRLVNSFSLLDVIQPIVDEFYSKYRISVDVAILENSALLQLYNRTDDDSYRSLVNYYYRVIGNMHQCLSIAKSILAFLPEEEMLPIIDRMHYVKRTHKSITDKNSLLEDLWETKKRGYAINDEEYELGLISIAAPFFNLKMGRPIGAVSFDFYGKQLSIANIEKKYASILLKLGKDISEAIK